MEQESTVFLDKLRPPRLEDAGLEDSALPPDSIKEAFLKAASAVKSRATSILSDNEEEGCVQDPWPEDEDFSDDVIAGTGSPMPDTLVGVETEKEDPGSCIAEKGGGLVEDGGDNVVVGGDDVEEREEENRCPNDGLKGLNIAEEEEENGGAAGGSGDEEEEEEEEEGKRPILTEGFV